MGESSRIEVEVEAGDETAVRSDLTRHGLDITWFFEKRRRVYSRAAGRLLVCLDEVPEIGWFIEIEGTIGEGRELAALLAASIGAVETRNYQELFLQYKEKQGLRREDVPGASFKAEFPRS